MCGFVGSFLFRESAPPAASPFGAGTLPPGHVPLVPRGIDDSRARTWKRMVNALTHRGPDAGALWVSDRRDVILGHRRLSIVDLDSSANQPFVSSSGHHAFVYNGEIYNHRELRESLDARRDGAWRTDHSDTETLVELWEAEGPNALDRTRGMFAFAAVDLRAHTLTLVRDRIGVKPLYWTEVPGGVLFASEIGALLEHPRVPRTFDTETLPRVAGLLVAGRPKTAVRGIHKLAPGTRLTFDANGNRTETRWYEPWSRVSPRIGVRREALVEELRQELRNAVEDRLESDRPVGVFLSGGVDSTTNLALFSEATSVPCQTFSVGYDRKYRSYESELDEARASAARYGADHRERELAPVEWYAHAEWIAKRMDEPLGDPVCFPVAMVAQLARSANVPVCQVGEGADELFLGYRSWHQFLDLERRAAWPLSRSLALVASRALGSTRKRHSLARELLRRHAGREPIFRGGAEGIRDSIQCELFPGLAGSSSVADFSSDEFRRFERLAWDRDSANWMTHIDLEHRLPELLLARVDKMTMASSVEARVPFLDHRIVEFALSVPARVRRAGPPKSLLKDAARPFVDAEVLDRPKRGFGVPIEDWLFGELRSPVEDELHDFARRSSILDARAVDRLFDDRRALEIWILHTLALWTRVQEVDFP